MTRPPRTPTAAAVTRLAARTHTELEWTARVIDIAMLNGWRVAHFRPAQTARGYRTPVQGHPGSPDLILARDGDVILAELKTDTGGFRAGQREWLAHLGDHAAVWRPRDSDKIIARLARKAPPT